jgi:hypothetical protein
MPETTTENPKAPFGPLSKFLSDFENLENGLQIFLETPPTDAKIAILAHQIYLEEMREAMISFRTEVGVLLNFLKSHHASQKLPKPNPPSLPPCETGTKLLADIRKHLALCRESIRPLVDEGNPDRPTHNDSKSPVLAHRLARADLMMDDLTFLFEHMGQIKSLEPTPKSIPRKNGAIASKPPAGPLDPEDDNEKPARHEARLDDKPYAEILCAQFSKNVEKNGLPQPYYIIPDSAKFFEMYESLMNVELYWVDPNLVDAEAYSKCLNTSQDSEKMELFVIRRHNAFLPVSVQRRATTSKKPTIVRKKWDRL